MIEYESIRDKAEGVAFDQIENGRWDSEIMNELIESEDVQQELFRYLLSGWITGEVCAIGLIKTGNAAIDRVASRIADSIQADLERQLHFLSRLHRKR